MEEIKHNAKERHEEMADFAFEMVQVIPYTDEFKAQVDATKRELGFPDEMKAIQFMIDTGRIEADDRARGGGVRNIAQVRLAMEEKFGCTKKTAMTHIKRAEMQVQFPGIALPQWGGARSGAGRPKQDETDLDAIAEIAATEAMGTGGIAPSGTLETQFIGGAE